MYNHKIRLDFEKVNLFDILCFGEPNSLSHSLPHKQGKLLGTAIRESLLDALDEADRVLRSNELCPVVAPDEETEDVATNFRVNVGDDVVTSHCPPL
jgi:hypothetical protein